MPSVVDVHTPYPGLRPFQSHEAEIFFGREQHTDRLLEILQREHFLAVIGPSGCGKSSLVRAGMLSALAAGWLGTGTTWRIAILRPGGRPFRRLARALLDDEVFGPELGSGPIPVDTTAPDRSIAAADDRAGAISRVEAELHRGPRGLIHLANDVRRITRGDRDFNLLLLVDQFEELFTYTTSHDAGSAEAFVDLLLTSRADESARLYVGITMRTDFLGQCVQFIDLPEAINRAQYLIPRLKRPELSRAIVGPAGLFGGTVDPSLAEELVNSVSGTQDELPVLQHVVSRMWDIARTEDPIAPHAGWRHYEQVGGVTEALSRHADAIYDSLLEEERTIAKLLFTCITERRTSSAGGQEVRRPQTLEQIGTATQRPWQGFVPVVERFSAEGVHFLNPIDLPAHAAAIVDVSHEALIRQWGKLRDWVQDEAERATDYRRWRDRAVERERGGELLAGADLARAIEWREGVSDAHGATLWHPTRAWARRYALAAEDTAASAEFDSVIHLIDVSEQAEQQRAAEARAAADRSQQIERERLEALTRAAEAEARVERERAEAAARQKAEADTHAELYRQEKLKAEAIAREALARQLATEALQYFADDPDRAQLLAVRAYETAPLPATELVLRQACVRGEGLTRVLRGHSGPVERATFSPDGRRVITVGQDRVVGIWDARSGASITRLSGHTAPVTSAATNRDGTSVVTTSSDGRVRVWDVLTGDVRFDLPVSTSPVINAVFSPDGDLLSAARDMTLWRWNITEGSLLATPAQLESPLHSSMVTGGVFSPDGRRILTTSTDRTARVWNAATQELMLILRGHDDSVSHAIFDNSGTRIATASEDGTIRLWGATSGNPLAVMSGHSGALSRLTFSADGERLLSGGNDGTARIWEVGKPRQVRELRSRLGGDDRRIDRVLDVAFSPDAQFVATASEDETARIWRTDDGQPVASLQGHTESVSSVAFSPDGSRLLTISWDGTAKLWDASTGRVVATLRSDGSVLTHAVFDPQGTWIVSGDDNGALHQWNATTGSPHRTTRQHSRKISRVVFSPDGRSVLTTSHDLSARLWDRALAVTAVLEGHPRQVLDGSFSADGANVLTTCADGSVRMWSARTASLLARIAPRPETSALAATAEFSADTHMVAWTTDDGAVYLSKVTDTLTTRVLRDADVTSQSRPEFSHDGTALLAIGADGSARVWRTDDYRRAALIRDDEAMLVRASFNHDGGAIITASADGFVRVFEPVVPADGPSLPSESSAADRWSQETAPTVLVLHGQGDAACVAMAPNNTRAIYTGRDATIRLCDSQTGLVHGVLTGHNDAIVDAAFDGSGTALVTASRDGTARIWRTDVGTPVSTLAHVGGKLHVARFSPDGARILTASQDRRVRLWSGQQFLSSLEFTGHGDAVVSAAFSPDGTTVLTANVDGAVRLWEVSSGVAMETFAGPQPSAAFNIATTARFSPDGDTWMIAGEDGQVHLGAKGTTTPARTWKCHDDAIVDAQFDQRGQLIATASKDGTARVWSLADGRLLDTLEHDAAMVSVSFSPDGSTLAAASERNAWLWTFRGKKRLHDLKGPRTRVAQIAFSPTGTTVATANGDGTACIWEPATGRMQRTLSGHQARVAHLAYSPDGQRVATASADRTTRIWDLATSEEPLVLFARHEPVTFVDFNADGRLLVTASLDGDVQLWDSATGSLIQTLTGHRASVRKAVFSPSGRFVASISQDRTARLWNAQSGQCLQEFIGHEDALLDVAMSPDDRLLITTSLDGSTRHWNVESGTQLAAAGQDVRPETGVTTRAEFIGASGTTLLTVANRSAAIWDVSPARLRTTLEAVGSAEDAAVRVACSAVSANGQLIATGTSDGRTRIWDTATGACVVEWAVPAEASTTPDQPQSLPSERVGVGCLAFAPDGSVIVTAYGKRAYVWDPRTGRLRCELSGHDEAILFAAFSSDGSLLATGSADKTARIWDAAAGHRLATLRGHANAVTHLAFNHDGRTIATASGDHTATVWDATTGRALISLRGHRAPVTTVDFSPDGTSLVTASHDGTASVWACQVCASPSAIADHIDHRIGRQLTSEETLAIGSASWPAPRN